MIVSYVVRATGIYGLAKTRFANICSNSNMENAALPPGVIDVKNVQIKKIKNVKNVKRDKNKKTYVNVIKNVNFS